MASLRDLGAYNGLPASFSVLHEFFTYLEVPAFPMREIYAQVDLGVGRVSTPTFRPPSGTT
jgi:hypothetical protein